MPTYVAIYAVLLAFLAVGNAVFCYFCVQAHGRMVDELRHERAKAKGLDIQLRNAKLQHEELARAHKVWMADHANCSPAKQGGRGGKH